MDLPYEINVVNSSSAYTWFFIPPFFVFFQPPLLLPLLLTFPIIAATHHCTTFQAGFNPSLSLLPLLVSFLSIWLAVCLFCLISLLSFFPDLCLSIYVCLSSSYSTFLLFLPSPRPFLSLFTFFLLYKIMVQYIWNLMAILSLFRRLSEFLSPYLEFMPL